MAFAKFQGNRFRIEREIGENQTIPANYEFGYIPLLVFAICT